MWFGGWGFNIVFRNFSLLSFGEEAEDDEDELMEVNKVH